MICREEDEEESDMCCLYVDPVGEYGCPNEDSGCGGDDKPIFSGKNATITVTALVAAAV